MMTEDFTNKYRPSELDEVIGNENVVKTLNYQFENDKIPQYCLFQGPRGTGKTTFARIIANHLIPDEDQQRMDMFELDIGNVSGVADARSIVKSMRKPPMLSEYRVWIFDEFHKASADAQTALLKVFEEPPEWVYAIVCTTDPQKLIGPIKSRASKYTTKPLTKAQMVKLLKEIAEEEEISVSKESLYRIYDVTEGHPREAIKILQQGENNKTDEEWEDLIAGSEVLKTSQDLVSALMRVSNWSTIADLLLELKASGQDVESIRRHIANAFANSMISEKGRKYAANSANVVEKFVDNFYDTGFAQLILACYDVWFDLKK